MYGKSVENSYVYRTYRVESELGSGGCGAVYKAWHKRLRKHLVIKEFISNRAGAIEARRNEVEALKNIRNIYVPQVYDFLIENDRSFSVMEYIEGESLDKPLRRGQTYSKSQIMKWYYQLASALEALHEQNICHRDIKPANIILMPNGDVCLIDFNAAFVGGNNTGLISRSIGYASPEQFRYFRLCENHIVAKEFNIDWKLSDIYSLGATMYHFLTGKRPPIIAGEANDIPTFRESSELILRIIERSMRISPSERFRSATELKESIHSRLKS